MRGTAEVGWPQRRENVEGMRLVERWGAEKGNHELHEWARMGDEGFFWTGWAGLGQGRGSHGGERGSRRKAGLKNGGA